MITQTVPSSSTAVPSPVPLLLPLEGEIITEQPTHSVEEVGSNATVLRGTESRRASTWLGGLALAFFLGLESLDRPSSAFHVQWLMSGGGSSTYPKSQVTVAREDILAALERISLEDLEDGMTHDLGICLASIIQRYHEIAMAPLAESILSGGVSSEIASHALRWLGRIKDPTSESSRLRLLHRGLKAASPLVRDGAALGLAALGARETIPMLRTAVQKEQIVGLRQDIEQVLRELEGLR